VKEIPILFSGEMVRAILDGRKVQTRRVIKPQPPATGHPAWTETKRGRSVHWYSDAIRTEPQVIGVSFSWAWPGVFARDAFPSGAGVMPHPDGAFCPYGQPGDRLWVREAWAVGKPCDDIRPRDLAEYNDESSQLAVDYKADAHRIWGDTGDCGKTRPGIHMPRWASRITLEVTGVRVERVQSISEADAIAEGVGSWRPDTMRYVAQNPVQEFSELWDSINAERGYSWESNPWVWVVGFRRLTQ
jgi:hypothetical protein